MNRVLKVGLVGCGLISPMHLDVYSILRDKVKVVGVCDLDPQSAKRIADRYHIPSTFTNHRDMLEAARPDIVDICTPLSSHMQIAVDSARAGCHVLVEKPMAQSVQECRTMINAAEQNHVSLCICHDRLFSPSLVKAKQILDTRGLKISLSALQMRASGLPPFIGKGGRLWENGCHAVYVQRFLLGRIERVFALSKPGSGPGYESFYGILQSRSGTLGFIDLSHWSAPAGIFRCSIDTETGERVDLDWVTEFFEIKKPRDPEGFGLDWSTKIFQDMSRLCRMRFGYAWKYLAAGGYRFFQVRHLSLIREFVENLDNNDPPVKGVDGLETVQILEALESSANRGEPTRIQVD